VSPRVFDLFFLVLVVGPTGRQFGAFELFLALFGRGIGTGGFGRGGFDRAHRWFVQGALFDTSGFCRLGIFRLFGHQHALGRIHHGANGFGLGQCLAAAFIAELGGLQFGLGFLLCPLIHCQFSRQGCGSGLFRGQGLWFSRRPFSLLGGQGLGFGGLAFGRNFRLLAANQLGLSLGLGFTAFEFGLVDDWRRCRRW